METESHASPPAGPGKAAVIAMLLLALVAAGVAWYVNYNRGRRALALFGAEGARLIRTAEHVDLLRSPPHEPLDLSHAPGLLNARTALLNDASYVWDVSNVRDAQPRLDSPQFTVRFGRGEQSVEVTFDFENHTIRPSSTNQTAVLQPKTAAGWQTYLARQTKPTNPTPQTPNPKPQTLNLEP